jgi:hypothetical protein
VSRRRAMLREPHHKTIFGQDDFVHCHAESRELLKLSHNCGNVHVVTRAQICATHVEHIVGLHNLRAYGRVLTKEILNNVTAKNSHKRMHHEIPRS